MIVRVFKKLFQILGINYLIDTINQKGILPSGVLLILVNILPILGVIFWGWNASDVIVLYWIENIVVAIYTILRILFAQNPSYNSAISEDGKQSVKSYGINIFLAIFFIFHFGIFTLVHGVFVGLFALRNSSFILDRDFTGLFVFFLALLISHGFSFVYNYIIKEEYKNDNSINAMIRPYPRIIILQFTLIFGGIISFVSSDVLIIIFVLMKILFDLSLHHKYHIKLYEDGEVFKTSPSISA
jgi:hypothetical protein